MNRETQDAVLYYAALAARALDDNRPPLARAYLVHLEAALLCQGWPPIGQGRGRKAAPYPIDLKTR